MLRVGEDTVRRYGAQGKLEVVRLNARTFRYTEESVAALIAASAGNRSTEVMT